MLSRLLASLILILAVRAPAQPALPASAHLPAAPESSKEAPPANPSTPLTLEEALALAEKNSPRLNAANARAARAAGSIQTGKGIHQSPIGVFRRSSSVA